MAYQRCVLAKADACPRAQSLALLLADLGVTPSHSRPYTSDGNPFSEAQFKTLQYHPGYPDHFGSIQDARTWARRSPPRHRRRFGLTRLQTGIFLKCLTEVISNP